MRLCSAEAVLGRLTGDEMSILRIGILDTGGDLANAVAVDGVPFRDGVTKGVPLRSPRTRGRGEKAVPLAGVVGADPVQETEGSTRAGGKAIRQQAHERAWVLKGLDRP